ncbi:MAG: DUF111 family protein, partial [Myxococcales bacterium]|nr:DUF111 family protein [Myxococcales bacterium]
MHLHLDCFSGIAGDMLLGALIELGAKPEQILSEIGRLGLNVEISFPKRDVGHAIFGTGVEVIDLDHHHHD